MAEFDGYVFVVAEYNHSITSALKNALDYLKPELKDKAAGFASYGSAGGARAVEHLRGILSELGAAHATTSCSRCSTTSRATRCSRPPRRPRPPSSPCWISSCCGPKAMQAVRAGEFDAVDAAAA